MKVKNTESQRQAKTEGNRGTKQHKTHQNEKSRTKCALRDEFEASRSANSTGVGKLPDEMGGNPTRQDGRPQKSVWTSPKTRWMPPTITVDGRGPKDQDEPKPLGTAIKTGELAEGSAPVHTSLCTRTPTSMTVIRILLWLCSPSIRA